MIATFIRLENTLEKAMQANLSPDDIFTLFYGVHLPPNDKYKYTQTTFASDGIEIETIETQFYSLCGTLLASPLPSPFFVERSFNDTETGLPQVEWSLYTDLLDFGEQLVYMRIKTGVNSYVYSSPFVISSDGADKTTQFWYKNNQLDSLQSISLAYYYRNRGSEDNLTKYADLGSSYDIVGIASRSKYERFFTEIIEANIYEQSKEIFDCPYVYTQDWFRRDMSLPVKTVPFNAMESKNPTAEENFNQFELMLSRNYKMTFNPNAVIPTPTPPVNPPTITLNSVVRVNANQVLYNFSTSPSPWTGSTYMQFQWNLSNSGPWNTSASGITSPQQIGVTANDVNDFFYRITVNGITSNVVKILKKSLSINGIVKLAPTSYRLSFSAANYVPSSQLKFEFSNENKEYRNALYADGNENPKDIKVPDETVPQPWFRITDSDSGIASEPFKYEE